MRPSRSPIRAFFGDTSSIIRIAAGFVMRNPRVRYLRQFHKARHHGDRCIVKHWKGERFMKNLLHEFWRCRDNQLFAFRYEEKRHSYLDIYYELTTLIFDLKSSELCDINDTFWAICRAKLINIANKMTVLIIASNFSGTSRPSGINLCSKIIC